MAGQLTVAIPTMDRWSRFLEKELPKYLENPSVDYVVVCDENGNDIDAICKTGLVENPKLRLYQNDTVLGVYGNKRQCLLRAPTPWVAVLDSDNTFDEDFFREFQKAVARDGAASETTVYSAGFIQRLDLDTGMSEDRTAHFSGLRISRENWNNVLDRKGWNFLLNDGNSIWPKEVVKYLPDLPEEQIVGTDSIFAVRQAIQAGYTLSVEPTMHYIHAVHSGSHWLQNATVSSKLLNMRDWRV
jgi:hypothetical protein